MITRNNYELYFIDYFEGNLDEVLVDEFLEFLQQNPDLKDELKSFITFSAEKEEVVFPGKNKLYREKYDSSDEFSQAAIATFEKKITPPEADKFQDYLNRHPQKEKEFQIFGHTLLKPDETIVFPGKRRLYRRPVISLDFVLRVAAAIIFLVAVSVLLNRNDKINPDKKQFAQTPSEKNQKPVFRESQATGTIALKPEPKTGIKNAGKENLKKNNKAAGQGKAGKTEAATAVRDEFTPEALAYKTPALPVTGAEPLFAGLAPLPSYSVPVQGPENENLLLVERIVDKTGAKPVNLNFVTRAGLNFVSLISNKKFTYETDEAGKITAYNYESNLLAFSIPGRAKE